MPSGPLDLFGTGPLACGDLDPGAPRIALHLTLASGTATWEQGRAGLARVAHRLAAEGLLRIEARLAAPRTSNLARMRTYVPLTFERDPRPTALGAFLAESLDAPGFEGEAPHSTPPAATAGGIPLHLTLSYRAEHACPPLALRAARFDSLGLVDLGDGAVLDVAHWRRVAVLEP